MAVHGVDVSPGVRQHDGVSDLVSAASHSCMLVQLRLLTGSRFCSTSQCLSVSVVPPGLSAVFMPTTLPGSPQELAELSYKRYNLPLNIPRPGLLSSSHPQTHIKATTFPVRRWCRRLSGGLKSRSAVTGPTSRGHRPPALLRTRCI